MQDGERDVARELDEECAPLDGEGELEEGAEGAQVRFHRCVHAAELHHCLAIALGVVEGGLVVFDMRQIGIRVTSGGGGGRGAVWLVVG